MSLGSVRELAAPAKVNLGLRIVARRDDGYHQLESLFVPLELGDALRVTIQEGRPGEVTLELAGEARAGVPDDETNLAVRAARAFLAAARLGVGVHIRLTKHIPSPAGLGGGSSDAGAVLRALRELAPGSLEDPALPELALGLGADVPFFLDPRPAHASGIGERLRPVAGLPALPLVLAHPGLGLSTARVYAAWDRSAPARDPAGLTPVCAAPTIDALRRLPALEPGERVDLGTLLHNDLEASATQLCPAVGELRREMEATGAQGVTMSGSGPVVLGIYRDAAGAERAARELRERLRPRGARVWITSTRASS